MFDRGHRRQGLLGRCARLSIPVMAKMVRSLWPYASDAPMLRCVRTQSVEISGVAVVLWRSKHRIRTRTSISAPFLENFFFSSFVVQISSRNYLQLVRLL